MQEFPRVVPVGQSVFEVVLVPSLCEDGQSGMFQIDLASRQILISRHVPDEYMACVAALAACRAWQLTTRILPVIGRVA